MSIIHIVITGITCFTVGGVIGYLIAKRKDKPIVSPNNPLPDEITGISEAEARVVKRYQKEWQIVIETQMHFNDLILRFRGLTLTSFSALAGGVIAIGELTEIEGTVLYLLLVLPIIFWFAAMAMDLGYYHRLLIGAVGEATKYDENTWFKKQGYFGLTATIRKSITPGIARSFVILYYIVPLIFVAIIMLWVSD
jgi:hypothetical protein